MRASFKYPALAALWVAVLITMSWAEEFSAPVEDHAIMRNGRDEIRLLIRFAIPPEVTDSTLTFAELTFAVSPAFAPDSVLRLDCHPVAAAWDPSTVGWDYPWQTPGGDFDDDATSMVTISARNDQIAYLDLTEIVRSWLNGNRPNNGLIFIIPRHIVSRYTLRHTPDLPEPVIGLLRLVTR